MILRRLVLANLFAHRVRAVLTFCAIALAVSLVVAVTTGYSSVEATAEQFLGQLMGNTDVQITCRDDHNAPFDQALAAQIARDPDVKSVVVRLQARIPLLDQQGSHSWTMGSASVIGIRRPEDRQVLSLNLEQGQWFDSARGDVAVIDQVAAERLGTGLGEEFTLPGVPNPLKLKVVGIVHKPSMLAMAMPTVYLPLETMQRFVNQPGQVNSINVALSQVERLASFEGRWAGKLDPRLRMHTAHEARQEMENRLRGIHFLAYLGGAVSMTAALFIIFSALSMGVTERSRTLAMLRAVGAERWMLGTMVLSEGLLLAAVGCAAGAILGWTWIKILALWKSQTFSAGVVVSWGGVALGVGGSLLAALAASFMPAYSAMRVSPLEAMSPLAKPTSSRLPFKCALAAIPFLALDPLLSWSPHLPPTLRLVAHFALGLPAEMVGFFLLAPLVVWAVERLCGTCVALLLGLQPTLLRQQLSSGIWRAAGTGCGLMVGLAVLIVMQIQGHSTLSTWDLPDRFPDVFILDPQGLPWDQQNVVQNVKGIRRGQVMPMAIARPGTPDSPFVALQVLGTPNATMFIGVDPDLATRMIDLEFRDSEGNLPDKAHEELLQCQALDGLKLPHRIIITNEMRLLKNYRIGDPMPLDTVHGTENFTICGIIWSPVIDALIQLFDLGSQFDQRTASYVFGTLAEAREDFGVERLHYFAANVDLGISKEELTADLSPQMRQQAATRPNFGIGAEVLTALSNSLGKLGLGIADVRHIKHNMQITFRRLLLILSSIALAAMAVASLGVANTLWASVRTRRWELGILRSIGLSRTQLLRLVLAEAILLGLVGITLGIACGAEMTCDARGLSLFLLGYDVPLAVPWRMIAVGGATLMAIALAASLWPALSASRQSPLSLLQGGRAAA